MTFRIFRVHLQSTAASLSFFKSLFAVTIQFVVFHKGTHVKQMIQW